MLIELAEEWDADLRSGDPLAFPDYGERAASLEHESVRTGVGTVGGAEVVLIEGDFEVIGGSMGLVHGEKVVRAYDRAVERRLPVVVVTRSGGARMQEGMVSLVQMARAAAAARRHADAGLLSIAVHRSPTTGGVFASYGSLTDLRVVEAGATIGFAGPRVVEQTTGASVAGRSHQADTAFAAGVVDAVLPADELEAWVAAALGVGTVALDVAEPPTGTDDGAAPVATEGSDGPAWAAVLDARRLGRPTGIHAAAALCESWVELSAGIDPVVRVALASVGDGRRAVVVALDRYAGSGKPTPDGFRLAQRGIELAGRLGLPVVAFVDTPGADPGSDAENDGVAREIARTFAAMAAVPVPTVGVCVGEGGSGGALAFVAADVFLVQQGAIFSVIGPEGAAAILERDAARAPVVAGLLRLTSADLLDLGIVDAVVPEADGATASGVVAPTVQAVRAALRALDGAPVGQGRRDRFDAATARWLHAR